MGFLEDVMKTLDRIPIWKRLQGVPDEVDALNQRVADLEEKLGSTWPPDVCKYCGERAARLTSTKGPTDKGKMIQSWACEKCNNIERRQV